MGGSKPLGDPSVDVERAERRGRIRVSPDPLGIGSGAQGEAVPEERIQLLLLPGHLLGRHASHPRVEVLDVPQRHELGGQVLELLTGAGLGDRAVPGQHAGHLRFGELGGDRWPDVRTKFLHLLAEPVLVEHQVAEGRSTGDVLRAKSLGVHVDRPGVVLGEQGQDAVAVLHRQGRVAEQREDNVLDRRSVERNRDEVNDQESARPKIPRQPEQPRQIVGRPDQAPLLALAAGLDDEDTADPASVHGVGDARGISERRLEDASRPLLAPRELDEALVVEGEECVDRLGRHLPRVLPQGRDHLVELLHPLLRPPASAGRAPAPPGSRSRPPCRTRRGRRGRAGRRSPRAAGRRRTR